jgi:hypothetical protein
VTTAVDLTTAVRNLILRGPSTETTVSVDGLFRFLLDQTSLEFIARQIGAHPRLALVEILCQEANMPSSILFSTGIGVADVLHMPYMPQNHGLEDVEAPRPFPIDVWHMFLQ